MQGRTWQPIHTRRLQKKELRGDKSGSAKLGNSVPAFGLVTRCAVLSNDGSVIAPEHIDKRIRTWDIESGKQLGILRYGDEDEDRCIAVSDDGKVISLWSENSIRVCDVDPIHCAQSSEPLSLDSSPLQEVRYSVPSNATCVAVDMKTQLYVFV